MALAENLNTIQDLLSTNGLESEIQRLELSISGTHPKDWFGDTSAYSMIDLWANHVSQRNSLSRKLIELPSSSPSPDIISLQFSLLNHSLDGLVSMNTRIEKLKIIQRAFQKEICHSLIKIFEWYCFTGPTAADFLVGLHKKKGYDGLLEAAPQFARLVDHIIQYVHYQFHQKASAPSRLQPKRRRVVKATETYSLNGICFGPLVADEEIGRIPEDLYGLCPMQANRPAKLVAIPVIKPNALVLRKMTESIYQASSTCLQQLWSQLVVIPKARLVDLEVISRGTSNTDDAIYQRCVSRGAILSAIATACNSDGIFASGCITQFLESPHLLFANALRRERTLVTEILARKNEVLQPLINWIQDHLRQYPELRAQTERLNSLAHHQMIELFARKRLAFGEEAVEVASGGSRVTKWGTLFDSIDKSITIDKALLPGQYNGFKIGKLGLILREALNQKRQLPPGNEILARVLAGIHATSSAETSHNPDHTNPIREDMEGVALLKVHISSTQMTSRFGLSNLLSWMGTGQGVRTKAFLKAITDQSSFFSTSLDNIINIFQPIITANEEIESQNKHANKPHLLPGYIQPSDMLIYGQPNNIFSHAPKDSNTSTGQSLTLHEKFGPYWDKNVQDAWVEFLGDMLDQDPLSYDGKRPSWKSVLLLITNVLKIKGFQSGISLLQVGNHMVSYHIVDPPEATPVAAWIKSGGKLGASRALLDLGVSLIADKAVRVAFICIFKHIEQHLMLSDSELLYFGAILLEYSLCKVSRFEDRLSREGAKGLLASLAEEVEEHSVWVSGANETDHNAFPFPLMISAEFVQKVIAEIS